MQPFSAKSDELTPICQLSDKLAEKHANICHRIQHLHETYRKTLLGIIEEYRVEMRKLESEGESFWQETYEANPVLQAVPERLFIGHDGRSVLSGFPIPGIPVVMFDKKPVEEVHADDSPTDATLTETVYDTEVASVGSRIKDFSASLFR